MGYVLGGIPAMQAVVVPPQRHKFRQFLGGDVPAMQALIVLLQTAKCNHAPTVFAFYLACFRQSWARMLLPHVRGNAGGFHLLAASPALHLLGLWRRAAVMVLRVSFVVILPTTAARAKHGASDLREAFGFRNLRCSVRVLARFGTLTLDNDSSADFVPVNPLCHKRPSCRWFLELHLRCAVHNDLVAEQTNLGVALDIDGFVFAQFGFADTIGQPFDSPKW